MDKENKKNQSPVSGCNEIQQSFDRKEIDFRAFAENSLIGIYIIQDGITKYVNSAIEKMTGYSREEICNKSPLFIIHSDDHALVIKNIRERLEGKEALPYEFRGFHKNGSLLWVRVIGGLITYEGRPALLGNMMDVTAIKKNEEMIKASEERYRKLFQGAAEGILVADIETRKFLYANQAICKMLGYTEAELTEKGVTDIHPKEDLARILGVFAALAKGEKSFVRNIPCLRKDGAKIITDISGTLMVIDGKKCNVGFFTDITERKQIEDALKESETQYRTIVENTDELITQVDENGRFVFVNHKAKNIFGIEPKDCIGRYAFDFVHPDDKEDTKDMFRKWVVSRDNYFTFENRQVNINGEIHQMLWTINTVRGNDGNIMGLLSIGHDITGRKRMENLLKENEHRLERIFAQSPIGAAIVSMQGFFVRVNEALCKMLGYTESELKALKYTDITHHDYLKNDMKNVTRLVKGELDKYEVDKRYVKKDGSVIWGHLSLILLRNESKEPLYFLPMVVDINEQKEAENRVQEQSKILEQKNVALSELLERITAEKEELAKKITSNLEKMILPKLNRLKHKSSDSQKRLFASIEKGIKDLSSGYGLKVTGKTAALTRRELEVCSMIKEGYKNKEIADELYLSPRTIETIRKSIRKKLKIRNKDVNLESYLKTL